MINTVTEAVAAAILNEFGASATVYTDVVPQGISEPCFSVICPTPEIVRKRGNRFLKKHPVAVYYFPAADSDEERNDVIDRLMLALQWITVNNIPQMASAVKSHVEDGVAIVMTNYDFPVVLQEIPGDCMETLETKAGAE